MLYGVDIHARYQAGISLSKLKAEGYSYLVTKATEGTGIPNVSSLSAAQFKARALGWVAEAKRLGMIPGLYHYLRAGDGAAQARVFHAFVRDAGGPAGLLIQLDCEADATWSDINEWHNEWRRLTGGHPYLLYTGAWWWNAAGRRWNGASLTPCLWHSHYLTADADTISDDPAAFAARIPASWWTPGYGGWSTATILQFTSRGDAGSLGNNVDLNATRLTREQLLALTRASGGGSAGPLPIGDDMANADWTHRDAYNANSYGYAVTQMLDTFSVVPGEDTTVPGTKIQVVNHFARLLRSMDTKVGALTTALTTALELLRTGGGDADTAAILARIDQRATEDAARDAAAAQREQQLLARIAELEDRLAAAARAEADALDKA